jgi:phenylpropionate dioxygenase-like ring-hydroxylating dioxygenase large terminal subunit
MTDKTVAGLAFGEARCEAVSFDELAQRDTKPVPEFLLEDGYRYLGSEPLSVDRYVSPAFFQLEIERMWPNVWQFAAREEELLEPGDSLVYENAGRSFLLIRQDDGSVRAFHNVCLHRGMKLRETSGRLTEVRCPFHAFTWNTDGSLKRIPCRWDFPHLQEKGMSLPEAEVGYWQGYIFIRENPGGPSIEEYVAPLSEHFARYRHDECHTVKWAAKVVAANWKANAEAFMEAFHVFSTHPQITPFTADANSKTFVWNDHANLTLTPFGLQSPHIPGVPRSEQWVMDQFLANNGRVVPLGETIAVEEGQTAREALGEYNRRRFSEMSGRDLGHASDAEVQDALTYNIFPNFAPWGGFAPNVVYRWRPWPDQDHTLMEVRILERLKPGEPRPPSVPMTFLGPDESWATALGLLGAILEQDWANLPRIQAGMKASKTRRIQLGNYQEVRIRHFHQTLDKYLSGELGSPSTPPPTL